MACAIVPPPYTYWGCLQTPTGVSDFAFHSGSLSILKQKLPSWCSSSTVLPSASASLTPSSSSAVLLLAAPSTLHHMQVLQSPRCDLNFSVLTPEHPYSHHFSVSEALLSWESVSVWMKCFGSYSWWIQVSEPLPGVCACIHVCKYMHMKIRGWYWMSFLITSPHYYYYCYWLYFFLRQDLLLNIELINLSRLAGQQATVLFPTPLCWCYRCCWLFMWVQRMVLRFLCFHSKHCTNWAVPASPVPRFCLL